MNLYGYVSNDPTNRVDPSGLCDSLSTCRVTQSNPRPQPSPEQVANNPGVVAAAILVPPAIIVGSAAGAFYAAPVLLGNAPAITEATAIFGEVVAPGAGAATLAAAGAKTLADGARAAGGFNGATASQLITADGKVFNSLSNRGQAGFATNPGVTATAKSAPDAPPFAGQCSECGVVSQARNSGTETAGGTIATVRVGTESHGNIVPPCASCEAVLGEAKIKTVTSH